MYDIQGDANQAQSIDNYGNRGHARTPSDESASQSLLNNVATAPGAHQLNDGEAAYTSILERKMAGMYDAQAQGGANQAQSIGNCGNGGHTRTLSNESARQSLLGSFVAERPRGVDRIDALIREKNANRSLIFDCASCCELLNILKQNSYSADILILALEKLRDLLPIAHVVPDHNHNHSMLNKEWPKIFAPIMSSKYSSNAIVHSGLLHTLWSIVSLNQRYISDLTLVAEMKDIIHVMEAHIEDESVQEFGCGLIACIGSSQKHALGLLRACNGKFIQLLIDALSYPYRGGNVQENALKALFRLSSASLSSDTPSEFFEMVCSLHGSHDRNSLENTMNTIIHSVQRYPKNTSLQIHGLRLLWTILDSDTVVGEDWHDLMLGKILQHTLAIKAHHQTSQAFHETIICILSKMSCYGLNSFGGQAFPLFVVEIMLAHPKSPVVALHGCRCITNVCDRSPTSELCQRAVASSNGIHAIISCMETFQESLSVQSESCAALSVICNNSPQNKQQVWRLGGIDRIVCAYDSYSWDEEMSTTTKIRACIALNTLLLDSRALQDMRNKGIPLKFEEEYSNASRPDDLRHVIQELLACETCETLRDNITAITTCNIARNNISNSRLRSNAIKAMKRFPKCAGIHEIGCKLIACIFATANAEFAGELQELEIIASSLNEHKDTPANVAAACSALRNLCVFRSTSSFYDVQDFSDILLRSFVIEVVNSMTLHQDDESTLEHASGALWALCAMEEGLVLSFASDNTIGIITKATNRFTESSHLQRHVIGILRTFFSVSDKGMDFLSDELVHAVIRSIEESDAVDTITAIDIILILTKKGFQALEILLGNRMLIDSIVGCMYRYPHSLSIQGAGIDILSNIALVNVLKTDVCHSGGTSRIIAALSTLNHDPSVVCKAYAALANLVGGADVEILRACNAPAVMVRAMTAHPHILSVQLGGSYALWALAERSAALFKEEIVNFGGAEAVAEAMARFVSSKQMQAKGFVVTWSLAVPRHLKSRVGKAVIESLVNGLSAHISNEKICYDGLGCIKCLSIHPANKELLEENGAIDLIHSCMWRHSGNSSVCEASLAALCNISVIVNPDLGDQVLQITNEDLELVCFVMRTHEHVKGVQEKAVCILKNFTRSPSNILVLLMNPSVAALVQKAMSTFNDSFEGRADYLLQVLAPHSTNIN